MCERLKCFEDRVAALAAALCSLPYVAHDLHIHITTAGFAQGFSRVARQGTTTFGVWSHNGCLCRANVLTCLTIVGSFCLACTTGARRWSILTGIDCAPFSRQHQGCTAIAVGSAEAPYSSLVHWHSLLCPGRGQLTAHSSSSALSQLSLQLAAH